MSFSRKQSPNYFSDNKSLGSSSTRKYSSNNISNYSSYDEKVKNDMNMNDHIFDILKSLDSRIKNIEIALNRVLSSYETKVEETNIFNKQIVSRIALLQENMSNLVILTGNNDDKQTLTLNIISHQLNEIVCKLPGDKKVSDVAHKNVSKTDSTSEEVVVRSRRRRRSIEIPENAPPDREQYHGQLNNVSLTKPLAHSLEIGQHKAHSLLPSKFKGPVRVEKNTEVADNFRSPKGLKNPAGYCYLNSVIQLLRGCKDFTEEVITYHTNSSIAYSTADQGEKKFVNDFFKLIYELKYRKDIKLRQSVLNIQSYFANASSGDDIMQSFMRVLTRIHSVINVKNALERSGSVSDMTADEAFRIYQKRNNGLVFDSFYGQTSHQTVCRTCNTIIKESFQLFKALGLPIPEDHENLELLSCIKCYYEESLVELESPQDKVKGFRCLCLNPERKKLYSLSKITHGPKYLFCYLNRGSYFNNGKKNNTFVRCGMHLNLQVESNTIVYQLISVVDHMGDNENGHYYVKTCFETKRWYLVNDEQVERITEQKAIVTKNTIVFLFKRIFPESF